MMRSSRKSYGNLVVHTPRNLTKHSRAGRLCSRAETTLDGGAATVDVEGEDEEEVKGGWRSACAQSLVKIAFSSLVTSTISTSNWPSSSWGERKMRDDRRKAKM